MTVKHNLKAENAFYAKTINAASSYSVGDLEFSPKLFHLVDTDRYMSSSLLSHETFEFSLLEFGRLEYIAAGREFQVGKGDVIAIPPGIPHTWSVLESPFLISGFQMYLKGESSSIGRFTRKLAAQNFHLTTFHQFREAMRLFRAEIDINDAYSAENIKLAIQPLLLDLARSFSPNSITPVSGRLDYSASQVSLMREFIDSNLSVPLQIAEVAHYVNMSPRNAARKFKEAFGVSIGEYILDSRMNEAKNRLTSSATNVKDIASEMGFEQNYFYRVFKNKFGISPSEFREIQT